MAKRIEAYRLGEVRQARKFTQVALAKELGVEQSAISRIESRTDLHMSTLRNHIEGTGGKLEILAVCPGHTLNIEVGK